jgi:membrane protein
MRVPEWAKGIEARAMAIRHRFDPLQEWVEQSILWRAWERVLENEFIDRSVALAAKAFVSLFPALIVVAAFAPVHVRNSILQTLTHRAGLSGSGLATVKGAFKSSNDVRKATGVVGLLFTFFYVNSFTSALGRVYTRAWRRPPGGRAGAYPMGAAWLIGVVAYFALIGGMRSILRGGPETAVFAIGALCASIGLWWLTPWLMLQRQVRWRPLVTGAILTGVGMSIYAASASLWMPRTVTENQNQFGFFGVALSLVTWLSGAGMIIVVSACVAPVLAEDDGWIGRLVRGSDDASLLVDGAKASLPAPLRAPTLVDAIRARGDAPEDEL